MPPKCKAFGCEEERESGKCYCSQHTTPHLENAEAADPAQSAPSADDYEAAKVWWQLQPHNATVALLAEYAVLRTAQLEKKYEAELWFFQQEIARLRKEKVAAETRVETVESALAAQKWVKVSECLPEHKQKVLIYRGNFSPDTQSATFFAEHSKGAGFYSGVFLDKVSHWRPLIAPPKDGL